MRGMHQPLGTSPPKPAPSRVRVIRFNRRWVDERHGSGINGARPTIIAWDFTALQAAWPAHGPTGWRKPTKRRVPA